MTHGTDPGVTPHLQTPRLDLPPLAVDDAAEMAVVLGDLSLYAFTGGEPPTESTLRRRYARLAAGPADPAREIWHNWIVRLVDDRTAVGTVQATLHPATANAEVAWVIGVRWQGRGFAGEAAEALVEWLGQIAITTVCAFVHPENAASASVARRIGLEPTDELVDGERVWRRTIGDAI
jgi:RimJ/RimL family protein N-acetyltransferase